MQTLQVSKLILKWNNDNWLREIGKSYNSKFWWNFVIIGDIKYCNENQLFNDLDILMIDMENGYVHTDIFLKNKCYMPMLVYNYSYFDKKLNSFIDLNNSKFDFKKVLHMSYGNNINLISKIVKKFNINLNDYDVQFNEQCVKSLKFMFYMNVNFRNDEYFCRRLKDVIIYYFITKPSIFIITLCWDGEKLFLNILGFMLKVSR